MATDATPPMPAVGNKQAPTFDIVKVPPERALVVDCGILASKRHVVYGLVEADVTKAREMIRFFNDNHSTIKNNNDANNDNNNHDKLGTAPTTQTKKLSFTAYVAACLAEAVKCEPRVQAYQSGRKKMVLFRDVHVSTMIEATGDKGGVAIPHILRNVDKRSIFDITEEIHSVKANPHKSEQKSGKLAQMATKIPRWLRMLFLKWMMSRPENIQKNCGTIMLTSVGMFGRGHGGFGVAYLPIHSVGVTVGGIYSKPAAILEEDGRTMKIEVREFVCLTIAFDHDVIDGAPAARFTSKFVELIESGRILEHELTQAGCRLPDQEAAAGITQEATASHDDVVSA